jgi:hypothetical protein
MQDTLDLQSGARKVAAMAMSFADNDANTFVIGSEDSNIYICSRHGKYVRTLFPGANRLTARQRS